MAEYTKPMVTIELDEYNDLKNSIGKLKKNNNNGVEALKHLFVILINRDIAFKDSIPYLKYVLEDFNEKSGFSFQLKRVDESRPYKIEDVKILKGNTEI